MKDDDLSRISQCSPHWPKGLRCAMCHGAPTCPMLHDSIWREAWDNSGAIGHQERDCTCPPDALNRLREMDYSHSRDCELRSGKRPLLCLECAERALGRELGLDDLSPCIANYAHYVMQSRKIPT